MSGRNFLIHAARDDFMTFARLAFEIVRPGVKFEDNWHLRAIAEMLRASEAAQDCRHIVTMPPRSLKSFLISEAFPAFLLGKDPATRIICVTYGEALSRELASNSARIMQSDIYRKIFPNTQIASETKLKISTSKGGMRFATSVGGATTGFGGDWIIVDDPLNAADANSQSARETVKAYFDQALSSRVNDETRAKFIIVMQRLHADDLAGHLLEKGGWTQLRLQAQATEKADINVGGGKVHEFKAGDLLHEKRLPQQVLDNRRKANSVGFQAQYQQDPVPAGGNIVRRPWLRYYTELPSRYDARVVLSLDTATKTSPEHDYSVCCVWFWRPEGHYLVNVWRDKVEYPQLKQTIIKLYGLYRPEHLLIEEHGNGAALIQELRAMSLPVVGRTPNKDKISRLVSSTSYIEGKQLLLPMAAPWLAEFESELLGFPNAKHDDQVDSLSQYFEWVRDRGPGLVVHSLRDPIDLEPETLSDVLAGLPRW